MELRGIGWVLPIDKNFPELGIGVDGLRIAQFCLKGPHLENREMWGTRTKRSRAADRSVRSTRLMEFQGYELGFLLAGVGQGVGIAAG
jgi:hypothetical protein